MPTVLLVDDDDMVRRLAATVLEKHGYRVVPARNGVEALMLHTSYPGEIDVILTDIVMPEMSGTEFALRVLEKHPGARIVLMSGLPPDGGNLPPGCPLVLKPFRQEALIAALEEVLRR